MVLEKTSDRNELLTMISNKSRKCQFLINFLLIKRIFEMI